MSILSIGELLDLGNSAATAGLVPYSALEYNASGDISGISGSAIAGGVDSAVVSSIVSSYVESSVSGKADQSALEDCCSAMSAVVSAKLDASASSQFQPSGNYQPSGDYYSATNPSGFITTADITGKLDTTASSLFQPSGSYADASSLSGKLDASASGMFQPSGEYAPTGDYAYNSSLSSKLDASASSQFYPMTGNPSGFLTGVDLTDYATTAYVDSSVSGKLDASASGQFQPSGEYYSASNPSGFITGVDLSDYATTAYVDSSVSSKVDQSAFDDCCSSVQSALSGKLDASASGEFYPSGNPSGFISGITTDSSLTGNGQPDSPIGIEKYDLALDTSMYSSFDGTTLTIGAYGGSGSGVSGNYWPQILLSNYSASADNSAYGYTINHQSSNSTSDRSSYTFLGAGDINLSSTISSDYSPIYRYAGITPTSVFESTKDASYSGRTVMTRDGLYIVESSVSTSQANGSSLYNYSGISGTATKTHQSWSLTPDRVSGLDSSGNTWQLGKAEYDYWNSKLDAVESAELVGASGIKIIQSGAKFVITLDPNYNP
jgi:hypothetical protein